jgi:hypothetical protein
MVHSQEDGMKVKLTCLALAASLTVTPAVAQEPEPDPIMIKARSRVRITTPDGQTLRGRLLSADGERLVIERGGRERTVAVGDVAILHVDHGRSKAPLLLAAGLGIALGAGLGAATAEAEAEKDCGWYDDRCRNRNDASDAELRGGALAGAIVGVTTGLILRHVTSHRRLQELSVARVRVGVDPLRKGVAAKVAFSF